MIHAVGKYGAGAPVNLGSQSFVGTGRKNMITIDLRNIGGQVAMLEADLTAAFAIPVEYVSHTKFALIQSQNSAVALDSGFNPGGTSEGLKIEGFLSQGNVALTLIFPIPVGCPNTQSSQDVIFVEGTGFQFDSDVGKMTGESGCPGTPPT
jgi:hypothetical protein